MKEQRLEIGADVLNGATLKRRAVVRRFESLTSATETTTKKPTSAANLKYWEQTNSGGGHSSSSEWYGVDGGLPTVRKILAAGWADGRQRLDQVSSQISASQEIARPVSVRRRRVRADQGDTLDMGRVWVGDLGQAWERCHRTAAATTRYLEILASPAINGGTDASVIFWRGAAALVLAEAATAAGYAVAITAVIPTTDTLTTGDVRDCLDIVSMKDYADPLDMDNLASLICLGGWFRYVWFQMAAHHSDTIEGGLGRARSIEEFINVASHQVSGLGSVSDLITAREWVSSNLANLGQGEQLAA
jgi:hypothetical protein